MRPLLTGSGRFCFRRTSVTVLRESREPLAAGTVRRRIPANRSVKYAKGTILIILSVCTAIRTNSAAAGNNVDKKGAFVDGNAAYLYFICRTDSVKLCLH